MVLICRGKISDACERAGLAYPFGEFSRQTNAVLGSLANAKGSWAGTMLSALGPTIAFLLQSHTQTDTPEGSPLQSKNHSHPLERREFGGIFVDLTSASSPRGSRHVHETGFPAILPACLARTRNEFLVYSSQALREHQNTGIDASRPFRFAATT
jgi:hypothetical protein